MDNDSIHTQLKALTKSYDKAIVCLSILFFLELYVLSNNIGILIEAYKNVSLSIALTFIETPFIVVIVIITSYTMSLILKNSRNINRVRELVKQYHSIDMDSDSDNDNAEYNTVDEHV